MATTKLLTTCPERVDYCRTAWAGSPTHRNDRHRSCPLQTFLPLLRTGGIACYSLQKGERSGDLKELPPEVAVRDLSPQINDFGDIALVVAQLDLIISVDTVSSILRAPWVSLSGRCSPMYPTGAGALMGKLHPGIPACASFAKPLPADWA